MRSDASSEARPDARRHLSRALAAVAIGIGLVVGSATKSRDRAGATGEPVDNDRPFGETRSTDEPLRLQRERAGEGGRGRDAISPVRIPWTGWKDIFLRIYEEIGKDRLLAVAAGVAFYSLLAMFPAITALVSSYGLFADISTIAEHLSWLSGLLPAGAFDIVRDQIGRVASKGGGQLTLGFAFGLGLALWSANAGMKAIFDALNVIYEEDEKRSFLRLNLVSLAFTFGAIVALLLAVAAVVVFPLALAFLGIQAVNPLLISLLRWPLLFLVIILGLALLYRYGPSRRRAEWRWVTAGSLLAALTWIAGSLAFSFYLANIGDYDGTYGSLGAVIGMMMWMWLSAVVVLVGAELNAEIEHQTACDSTEGEEKPLGARGAAMADTVGAARAN